MTAHKSDVLIVGAGGAGLMCALSAGQRGRSVQVLDHARAPGEKIRISGGGRCNFTNLHTSPANFLSDNPHFCISALRTYTQRDFIEMVERHTIAYHEKTLGQLFCDESSQGIIGMLLEECEEAGVQLQLNANVTGVRAADGGYEVETDRGAYACASLVIATGGKSIPKMGATGFGYDIARQFGLKIVEPRPALVPLTFSDVLKQRFTTLAGISVDAVVSCDKTSFAEGLLFTHKGLSGPSILQISSYWREGEEIVVDFAPHTDVFAQLRDARAAHPRQGLIAPLAELLPKRLAENIVEHLEWGGLNPIERMADASDRHLHFITAAIRQWRFTPTGTEGFRIAEVTIGGVDTSELSSRTMEARNVPGLFFVGEVVDVTGQLGGFNFQWAWSSGFVAGQYA